MLPASVLFWSNSGTCDTVYMGYNHMTLYNLATKIWPNGEGSTKNIPNSTAQMLTFQIEIYYDFNSFHAGFENMD